MQLQIPRVVIAGTHSGVGKTTIVTGLLAALRRRGLQIQSYKVGPDYIDPGYHRLASGKPSHNLDTWLAPETEIAGLFAKTAQGNDLAVIEGVMGLYDGGRSGVSSTAAIAKLLRAPVVLVVDARSMGESVAAVALGYKMYDPEVEFAGVIVNRLGSESHRRMVTEALERQGIPVLGCIFRDEALTMPERHLGLTPVTEHEARDNVAAMGERVERQVAVEELLTLARQAAPLAVVAPSKRPMAKMVRIAVAEDDVFTFYYRESLDVLSECGAELVFFSPLRDRELPEVDGLVLGGGFPEMFVGELAANDTMRRSVLAACRRGLPVYAECGGLMYLCRQLVDFDGQAYDMAGVVPAVCHMQSRLETVGYVEARALSDNPLVGSGEVLRGHEFHFSRMTPDGDAAQFPWAFEFRKVRTGACYPGGFARDNVLASYLHMHFAGNRPAAARFVARCDEYRRKRSD